MTRQEVMDQLLDAPKHVFSAEAGLLNAEQCHRSAKEALADREASLMIEGLAGKNADERQARLREQTESLRAQVEETRVHVEFLRLAAESERAKFSSLRAVAKLMAVEDAGLAEVIGKLDHLQTIFAQEAAEVGMHVARLEETQEAHGEAIVRLEGQQGDAAREAQAVAALATRLLDLEATVARLAGTQQGHTEALGELLTRGDVVA